MGIDRVGIREVPVKQEILQERLKLIEEMRKPGWFDKEENRDHWKDFFPRYNEAPVTDLDYNSKVIEFVSEVYLNDTPKMKYWAEDFIIRSFPTVENILVKGINDCGGEVGKIDSLTRETIGLVNEVFAGSSYDVFSDTDEYRDKVSDLYSKHPEWISFFLSEVSISQDLNRDIYAYLYYKDKKNEDGSFTKLIKNSNWLRRYWFGIAATLDDMCEADNVTEAKWMSDFILRKFGVDSFQVGRITEPLLSEELAENMKVILIWEAKSPGFFAEVSKELLSKKSDFWWYSPNSLHKILSSVLANTKEISMKDKCKEAMAQPFKDKAYTKFVRSMGIRQIAVDSIAKEIISEYVASLDIEKDIMDDCVNSWITFDSSKYDSDHGVGKGIDKYIDIVVRNVNCLAWLKERVGMEGIRRLHDFYGITHFERYSADFLIDQLGDEEKSGPYGIWLGPYSDYNSGFLDQKRLMDNLIPDKNELNYKIKVIEARDKFSVAKRIIGLDRKFGEKNKIAFVVINGHGSPGSIQLGVGKDDCMAISDLKNEKVYRMKQYYQEKMPFVFNSCSTGQEIGPAYARYVGGISIAPSAPGYTKELVLKRDSNGVLFFKAKYGGKDNPSAVVTNIQD